MRSQQADAIVYDALVDPRILALARPGAALEDAGKRGGRPSARQPDISAAADRAGPRRAGACCVSRAATRASSAAAARRRWRWPRPASRSASCPASPPAIGGLAYAGIPVTHRGINSAVTLVTGHDSDGAVPEDGPDWPALARGSPVIVLYMALRHLDDIAARLVDAGRAAGEPVAIVSKATTAAQRVGDDDIGRDGRSRQGAIEGPAIIVIGEVARLHDTLDWFGKE